MTSPSDAWGWLDRPEPWLVVAAVVAIPLAVWVLKAAPTAAAEDDATEPPPTSYRDRVFAGVAVGLALIVLGAFLAVRHGVAWSSPAFAAGFALVARLIAINDRYRHVSPALRRTTTLARAGLNATLVAGFLLVVNVIAYRYGGPALDLTRERTYSLSSQSRNQLESLDVPVVFHLVHGRSALARRREDRVAQLLELYRAARPDLARVERLDRYAELARGDELAERAPELTMMPGGGVLIEYGEGDQARFATIGNQEMFLAEGPESGDGVGVYASEFRGEDAITSALIRLREGVATRIGFTVGHGESSPDRPAPAGSGIARWTARLEAAGCEAAPVNLLEGPVPEDVELLIVAGPKEAFKPHEAARIQEYADRGGPVLACLDGSAPTGLEAFLKSFNLELGPGRLVDPRLNLDGRASFVFCPPEPGLRHPLTDGLAGDRAILIVDGSPIRFVGTEGAADPSPASINSRMLPAAVLRSGPSSWIETDPDASPPAFDKDEDRPGPAVAAAAVAERAATPPNAPPAEPKPRLALISSKAVGTDAAVETEPTNLDLLMNAVAWLRGRGDSIGVPAKVHSALTLVADPGLRRRLVLAPTVVAAACLAGLGALVYMIRRD